ncbi:hypothetical protein RUM44_003118 [Polyplax serrata]|uniref:Uncharacterized protein n=1 Tax=Polyplax serrata TaxID=468196 RepID=A0ABR1AXM7_POLSC
MNETQVGQSPLYRVQETDGSFFESFTALTWKQENRRLLIHQDIEVKNDEPTGPPGQPSEVKISARDLEHLYVEVLYTIKNKVGVSTGQYAHYQEELYQYAQEAFNIQPQRHRKLLAVASEEKPPIVVLNVVVVEAENLEAKDANGES